MAPRDPGQVASDLVAHVQDLSQRAGREAAEAEVRAALLGLSPAEEARLRRFGAAKVPAQPLGPMAWADIARGVAPQTAAARELGGYYALLAERDALASLLQARTPPVAASATPAPSPAPAAEAAPPRPKRESVPAKREPAPAAKREPAPPPAKARVRSAAQAAHEAELDAPPPRPRKLPPGPGALGRAEQILGLFSYHRDAPLVARELRLSMEELELEIDGLSLRRKTARLVRGLDIDLPRATALAGVPSGPSVRRRAPKSAAKAEPPPPPAHADEGAAERAQQSEELRKILREVGPRRAALAARLGTAKTPLPMPVMLARFRAAGLERELGQRERDLMRALLSRHRCSLAQAAKELQLPREGLEALIAERGLTREVEANREAMREKVRARDADRDRVDQVLRQRDWLADLGVYDELDAQLDQRTHALWEEAHAAGIAGGKAIEWLRTKLKVPPPDVRALVARYKLKR